MSFLSEIANSLNLSANWLLILLFFGVGAAYGLVMGKNRMALIAIAGYFSLIVSRSIPWDVFGLKQAPDVNVQIFLFLAIILGFFFLAPHSGFSSLIKISSRGRASWWQVLVFGVAELGFLISAVISFLPPKDIKDVSSLAADFFGKSPAPFIWLILPIIVMFVLKKRRSYTYANDD